MVLAITRQDGHIIQRQSYCCQTRCILGSSSISPFSYGYIDFHVDQASGYILFRPFLVLRSFYVSSERQKIRKESLPIRPSMNTFPQARGTFLI